jgi:hypothetical protein
MPKGPKGQKRPADINQLAKAIVDIATGDTEDVTPADKDPSAVQRGRKGAVSAGKCALLG